MYVVNDFNPRTPQGGATGLTLFAEHRSLFQSTHPTRGCDGQLLASFLHTRISIHAPHEGVRPVVLAPVYYLICPFQSTHPTRGCDCVLVLAAS